MTISKKSKKTTTKQSNTSLATRSPIEPFETERFESYRAYCLQPRDFEDFGACEIGKDRQKASQNAYPIKSLLRDLAETYLLYKSAKREDNINDFILHKAKFEKIIEKLHLAYGENKYLAAEIGTLILILWEQKNREIFVFLRSVLLATLKKMKLPAEKSNTAMGYRQLWKYTKYLSGFFSGFTEGEAWLLKSLEAYQALGDQSAMAEMCDEVHFGGAVTSHQVMKMRKTIRSFMENGSKAIPA